MAVAAETGTERAAGGADLPATAGAGDRPAPRPVRLAPSLIRSGAGFRLALALTVAGLSILSVLLVTG